MSTTPETPTAPVGTHVHVLHRFGRDSEISLYHSYPAALAALAPAVRADWSSITYREDTPASPDELSDAEVVLAYFGGNGRSGGPDAPTFGMSLDAGFVISEDVVAGPEPSVVSLRMATLRVLDADRADIAAVTYCLDAAGLTITVYTGPDGYPAVSITPGTSPGGVPITVRLGGAFRPDGVEQTYRVS